jgi:hypothetical protein
LIQAGNNLGFEPFPDSLYDMGLDSARFGSIPHSDRALTIDFYANGPNWNRPANESWAIENVEVILLGVPEPASMPLLLFSVTLIAGMRRCKRSGRSEPKSAPERRAYLQNQRRALEGHDRP